MRLDLEGTKGEVNGWQLTSIPQSFEKGRVDNFDLYVKDLGDLKRLHVDQDGSGSGSGWYLKKIYVTKVNRPSKTWKFHFNRWLDGSSGTAATKAPSSN